MGNLQTQVAINATVINCLAYRVIAIILDIVKSGAEFTNK